MHDQILILSDKSNLKNIIPQQGLEIYNFEELEISTHDPRAPIHRNIISRDIILPLCQSPAPRLSRFTSSIFPRH